jgi:hypothetical protein
MYAGTKHIPIKGSEVVPITLYISDSKTQVVKLKNVAFVPSFHTSIVLYYCYEKNCGHWDMSKKQLMQKEKVFGKVFKMLNQHVLEFTPASTTSATAVFPAASYAPRRASLATTDIWHCCIGHIHADALIKLPAAAEGVKVNTSSLSPCRTCALAKAKEIISCHQTERATILLGCVYLDLIPLSRVSQGDCWVLYYLDSFTRMNFEYTLTAESQASCSVQNLAAFVCCQFEHKVIVFRTNNKCSLGRDFKAWIKQKGIGL